MGELADTEPESRSTQAPVDTADDGSFDVADGYDIKRLKNGDNKKSAHVRMSHLSPSWRPNSAGDMEHGGGDGEDQTDFWDHISQYSIRMRRDSRYFFQHPYSRLLIAYLVTFCNFLIYAEDPVAHSSAECNIPVVGNVYSFVVTKYPPNGFSALKVFLWLTGIVLGCLLGKFVIHRLLLKRLFKLQMFQQDMGTFMVMFITTIAMLFAFSWLYNAFLLAGGDAMQPYMISGYMSMKNSTFMKAAACGTWLGDFFTAWMVTDVMLQELFYPDWARRARVWWNRGKNRIIFFWCAALLATIIVVMVIATDWIRWDKINASFLATNELSRAFLASFILVMDLLIVMQDWDFPHFINHMDIKLPGLNTANLKVKIPQVCKRLEKMTIHITGKWFNYGIIFLVMLLDLNMWKNQIFYAPADYAQYTDHKGFIYSYRSDDLFFTLGQNSNFTSSLNESDSDSIYFTDEVRMESRYHGFSLGVKLTAFIPALIGFAVFIALIFIYGRIKPTKKDPYGGRLIKTPKSHKPKLGLFTMAKMKLLGRSKRSRSVDAAENVIAATEDSRPSTTSAANKFRAAASAASKMPVDVHQSAPAGGDNHNTNNNNNDRSLDVVDNAMTF